MKFFCISECYSTYKSYYLINFNEIFDKNKDGFFKNEIFP